MTPRFRWGALAALLITVAPGLHAQAREGSMTQAEIETLRDAAYVPPDRIRTYMRILDDREKAIETLLRGHRGADFAADMHDLLDQYGGIVDELNDNLDSLHEKKRDLRKVLPRLVEATDRWSTVLRAAPDDDRYNIVRKVALDAVRDTHEIAEQDLTEEAAYFKEHPEAAKAEKDRLDNPHAPQ